MRLKVYYDIKIQSYSSDKDCVMSDTYKDYLQSDYATEEEESFSFIKNKPLYNNLKDINVLSEGNFSDFEATTEAFMPYYYFKDIEIPVSDIDDKWFHLVSVGLDAYFQIKEEDIYYKYRGFGYYIFLFIHYSNNQAYITLYVNTNQNFDYKIYSTNNKVKLFPSTLSENYYLGDKIISNSDCLALAEGSCSLGKENLAAAMYSTCFGYNCTSGGDFSFAQGCGLIATGSYQHVIGSYNLEDRDKKYLFIVGNGTGESTKRNNAFTLDKTGNLWTNGNIETENSLILTSASGGKYKISVDNSGNLITECINKR